VDVLCHDFFQLALGFQDVLDGIANGAFASTVVGDYVGLVLNLFAGVGDGDGETSGAHGGEIDDVVTDECGLVGGEILLLKNFSHGGELVIGTLVDVLYLEVAAAEADGLRDALGDYAEFQPTKSGERDAGTVVGVETLGFDDLVRGDAVATGVSLGFGGAADLLLGSGGRGKRKMVPSVMTPSTSRRMSLIFFARALDMGTNE
jgi:hypothetical protein